MKRLQLSCLILVCSFAGTLSAAQEPQPTATAGQTTTQNQGTQKPGTQAAGGERQRPRGGEGGGGMMQLLQNATTGTVQTLTADGMTVKKMDGTTLTVKTTKETMFRRERQEAKLTDFKVGDVVMVAGDPAGENTVAARFVVLRPNGPNAMNPEDLGKKFILGEVTKIEETKLTIKRPDGVEQVIEVDDDTSFRNTKQESVTLADVKVGDHVMGRGALKNGTFVPATLMVGLPTGRQGFMGRRREGAEGRKDGSTPPSTVPQNQSAPAGSNPKQE